MASKNVLLITSLPIVGVYVVLKVNVPGRTISLSCIIYDYETVGTTLPYVISALHINSESAIVLERLSVIYILGVSTLIGFIDGKNLMRAIPLASYIPNSVVF